MGHVDIEFRYMYMSLDIFRDISGWRVVTPHLYFYLCFNASMLMLMSVHIFLLSISRVSDYQDIMSAVTAFQDIWSNEEL